MPGWAMAPLREADFRRLFIGQAVSGLGNALVPVSLAFAILALTNSPTDLGITLGVRAAAQLIFILAGGVIADRLSRRTVMIGADAVRCVTEAAVSALLLAGHPSVWTLSLLVGSQGIAAAVFTPASAGLTPAVVSPANLQSANMLQGMAASGAMIAGPALAGLLVVSVGPGWAMLADSFSFAVSIVLLARMRVTRPPRPADQRFLRELRQGWTELRDRTWFWVTAISSTAVNGLIGVYLVLGPQISRLHYGGAGAWAATVTAGGIGAAAGGIVTMRLRWRYPLRATVPMAALYGLLPIGFAAGLPLPAIVVVAAAGSLGALTFGGVFQTMVQLHFPEQVLSRVSAYEWFGGLVAYPAGLALAGPLAEAIGIGPVLWSAGAVQVVVVLALLLVPAVRNLTAPAEPGRDGPALAERKDAAWTELSGGGKEQLDGSW